MTMFITTFCVLTVGLQKQILSYDNAETLCNFIFYGSQERTTECLTILYYSIDTDKLLCGR